VTLGVAAAGTAVPQSLARRLDRILDADPLTRQFWGVVVADSTGRLVYSRNAERLFTPASTAKLAVAAAATVLLGPDWRATTSLYGTGPVVDGVLQGHLVLYGRGDPTIGARCYDVDTTRNGACDRDAFGPLRVLARGLREQGVRVVAGDVVGDGSWFDPEVLHPAWEHADLAWWYAAPVSGLGFAGNSYELVVTPTVEDAPAALAVSPEMGALLLENRTRTVRPGARRTLHLVRETLDGALRLVVSGEIPADAPPRTESVAVNDPARYTALALRRTLAEEGIAVLGRTWSTTDSLLFRSARTAALPLAEVRSRPVSDWLFPLLNTSHNWFADMLFKQVGRQATGIGTWSAGREVVRRFLVDSVGVDSTQVHLSDGSGLAATNLIAPTALIRLLAYMRHHPRASVFLRGFPVAGRSGSLRNRLARSPLEGRVAAKTGTLTGVNGLAGYVERPRGGPLIFAILANHHTLGNAMIGVIDSVVAEIGR
jgi:D-alanyl-D-alanine carboxypeptidase/D-alanyl-D-alanine-endopeptidase (penicillin-binding protein 4)